MTPNRWSDVDRVYHDAAARSAGEREAFLREACAGDEALRAEVESLLAQAASAEGFLAAPALGAAPSLMGHLGESIVGRRLGCYHVQTLLGAGGMGEVYRARDTKLGRDVAIKILPRGFTTDAERLARFEREARLLAAVNHPNIATIYGVEEADGVLALILELVEGETLADRLQRGPLPMTEARAVARQIADALEAAHEKGIIHRDLKPANVKITADGRVKVLDFGLAKAAAGDSSTPDATQSPTVTVGGTRDGAILGTAAYMSPEQARGQVVDKRTDIWAFGCVLYEMLTGCAVFSRGTISDTLAAVLEREPSWERLPDRTSPSVRSLLRHCLEKDPARRLRDIGDARFDLEDSEVPVPATLPATNRRAPLRKLIMSAASAAAIASLVTAVVEWRALGRASIHENNRVLRFNINPPQGVDYTGGELAISPDGTRIVYPAVAAGTKAKRLYLRDLHQLNAIPIADTDDAAGPFFSPDGEWLAFVANGKLKKAALRARGEPPITICDVGALLGGVLGFQGASWGPDGIIVFSAGGLRAGGLYRVSAAGGVPATLTKPDPAQHEQRHAWPTFLPGGKAVLFAVLSSGQVAFVDARIAVVSLETGEHHTVIERGYHPRFVFSGHIVYTQDDSEGTASFGGIGTLMAVPFDADRLVASGPPVPLVPGVRGQTITGNSYFDVSPDGVLVYAPGESGTWQAHRLVWVDRQGREETVPAPLHAYMFPRISSDGSRVAVNILEADSDIWIWDVARHNLSRLTLGGGIHTNPVWTPDGRRVAFASRRTTPAAPYNLFWQDADGAGPAERLGLESATSRFPYQFSRDGNRLLVQDTDQTSTNVRVLALDDGRRTTPLLQASFNQRAAALSPDGRFVAFQSDESGRGEIYVRPFPNVTAGRWQMSTSGGDGPVWDPSGRGLFYIAVSGDTMHVMNVSIHLGATFEAGVPRELFAGKYVDFLGLNYDVSPDGRHLLMVKSANEAAPHPATSAGMIIVVNWLEELKARVPPESKPLR